MYKFLRIKNGVTEFVYGNKVLYFEVTEIKKITVIKIKNYNNMGIMILLSATLITALQQFVPTLWFIAAFLITTALNIQVFINKSHIYYVHFKIMNKEDVWLKIKRKHKDEIKKEIGTFADYSFNYNTARA